MRAFILAVALILGLPGCATLGTTGVDTRQSATVQQAQGAINEANAALTAVANVIAQNISDGTMTKADAAAALTQVMEYAGKADDAQKLLNRGLTLDAKSQADLVSGLISALHKQVAAKARKP